jgi:hypothetical protein
MGGDSGVIQVAEVVVEELARGCRALLDLVDHRLVLEQVLAAFDGPDLPAVGLAGDEVGERLEVRGARGGAGVEHEHVGRLARADLEDADPVELVGRLR